MDDPSKFKQEMFHELNIKQTDLEGFGGQLSLYETSLLLIWTMKK